MAHAATPSDEAATGDRYKCASAVGMQPSQLSEGARRNSLFVVLAALILACTACFLALRRAAPHASSSDAHASRILKGRQHGALPNPFGPNPTPFVDSASVIPTAAEEEGTGTVGVQLILLSLASQTLANDNGAEVAPNLLPSSWDAGPLRCYVANSTSFYDARRGKCRQINDIRAVAVAAAGAAPLPTDPTLVPILDALALAPVSYGGNGQPRQRCPTNS